MGESKITDYFLYVFIYECRGLLLGAKVALFFALSCSIGCRGLLVLLYFMYYNTYLVSYELIYFLLCLHEQILYDVCINLLLCYYSILLMTILSQQWIWSRMMCNNEHSIICIIIGLSVGKSQIHQDAHHSPSRQKRFSNDIVANMLNMIEEP